MQTDLLHKKYLDADFPLELVIRHIRKFCFFLFLFTSREFFTYFKTSQAVGKVLQIQTYALRAVRVSSS